MLLTLVNAITNFTELTNMVIPYKKFLRKCTSRVRTLNFTKGYFKLTLLVNGRVWIRTREFWQWEHWSDVIALYTTGQLLWRYKHTLKMQMIRRRLIEDGQWKYCTLSSEKENGCRLNWGYSNKDGVCTRKRHRCNGSHVPMQGFVASF